MTRFAVPRVLARAREGAAARRLFPGLPAGIFFGAAVLVGAGFLACGRDAGEDPVVLTVDGRDARLAEVRRAYENFVASDTAVVADTASLRQFVQVYTDRLLSEALAQQDVPDLPEGPSDRLAEWRERTMVEALRKEAYGDAYTVPESELRKGYDLHAREVHMRYMVLPDAADAEQVLRALREGAVFDKVARQKSLDSRTRDQGGDVGWIRYTDLDPSVRDQIFALEAGQTAGPFPSGREVQIFQVVETRPNQTRGSFETERAALERGIMIDRVQKAKAKYERGLFEKYDFRLDPAEVAWMAALLYEKTSRVKRGVDAIAQDPEDEFGLTATRPDANRPIWDGPPVALADTGRVLARFDAAEREVKPLLVIDQLMTHPTAAWPTFERTDDVERLIRDLVLERLEIAEAEARGIPQWPEFVAELNDQREQIRTRFWYRTVLRPQGRPTEEEARAYYAAHAEEFSTPERRRFAAVHSTNWDTAVAAMEMLRAGRTVDEVTARFSAEESGFNSTGSAGTPPLEYGKSPLLDDALFRLPLGAVSDPIPVGSGFTVSQVVEILPETRTPFEEVQGTILNRIAVERADSLLDHKVREAREQAQVTVDWDRLRSALLERD